MPSPWIVAGVGMTGAAAASVASRRFGRRVDEHIRRMHASAGEGARLARARLADLPSPIRRYLELALGEREHAPGRLAVVHAGGFRPSLDGRMLPIRGEQHFTTDPPGFVWWGRLSIFPGVWIDARDRSVAGEGEMYVRLESLIPLADARGPELDQGALTRLLAELVWLPAVLCDARYVSWTPIDARSARATLRVGGREASAVFELGEDDLPRRISGQRHRADGKRSVLTPWSGECSDYREASGMLVPHRMQSVWHVEGWSVTVADFRVQRLTYDANGAAD